MAAGAVGATRLHRPEWCTVHPKTGDVYLRADAGMGLAVDGRSSAVSSWPYGDTRRPRPSTVVIRKLDGGRIGS